MKEPGKNYSRKEERLNVVSHGLGLALSVLALVLLILRSLEALSVLMTGAFIVYGLSLVILYAASTFYHSAKEPVLRYRLKVFDHIAIFILIAGTYTPFSLVSLQGRTGWIILGVAWGIAFLGAALKIFFTRKYKILSTLMYVGMGWIIILE